MTSKDQFYQDTIRGVYLRGMVIIVLHVGSTFFNRFNYFRAVKIQNMCFTLRFVLKWNGIQTKSAFSDKYLPHVELASLVEDA